MFEDKALRIRGFVWREETKCPGAKKESGRTTCFRPTQAANPTDDGDKGQLVPTTAEPQKPQICKGARQGASLQVP